MLEAEALQVVFPDRSRKPLLGRPPDLTVLEGVDLRIDAGETLGIVGESGSGKSTLGRTLIRLCEPRAGHLHFDGREITHLDEPRLRPYRDKMQMIFQDPQSSLNPRRRVADIVMQPLVSFDRVKNRREGRRRAAALLERVGLPAEYGSRYPHQLSGGQRQRIGIARAIALQPRLIVADEIVSGLDASTQAQILALLRTLKETLGLALVFISHDLSVVRVLCERVMVLHAGKVAESGSCTEVFEHPRHPRTQALLSAIPLPEVDPDWLEREDVPAIVP